MFHDQPPAFKTLAELFTSIGLYDNRIPRDTLPAMGDRVDSGRIGRYLCRSGGAFQAYSVVPTDELIKWCRDNMLDISRDTLYFQFIVWRKTADGRNDVSGTGEIERVGFFVKYNLIIGCRLLAYVSADECAALGMTIA